MALKVGVSRGHNEAFRCKRLPSSRDELVLRANDVDGRWLPHVRDLLASLIDPGIEGEVTE